MEFDWSSYLKEDFNQNLFLGLKWKSTKLLKLDSCVKSSIQFGSWKLMLWKKKKNGRLWVCVDFWDLNQACSKDDFPVSKMEKMVDTTTGYEVLSFMNVSLGYNKIWMNLKDEELILFRTSKGRCCYKVKPFGL